MNKNAIFKNLHYTNIERKETNKTATIELCPRDQYVQTIIIMYRISNNFMNIVQELFSIC